MLRVKTRPLFTYSKILVSSPHVLLITQEYSFTDAPRTIALKSLHAFVSTTTAALVLSEHRASAHQFLGCHPKSYFKHGGAEMMLRR